MHSMEVLRLCRVGLPPLTRPLTSGVADGLAKLGSADTESAQTQGDGEQRTSIVHTDSPSLPDGRAHCEDTFAFVLHNEPAVEDAAVLSIK